MGVHALVEMLDDALEEVKARRRKSVHDAAYAGDFGIKIRSIKGYCCAFSICRKVAGRRLGTH